MCDDNASDMSVDITADTALAGWSQLTGDIITPRLCQVMSCPSWRTFIIKQISNSYEQRGSEDWVLPRSRFILDIHNKVTITDLILWSHSQNLCSDPTLSMVTSLSVFLPYDVQEYDVQVRYPMTAPVGMYFLRQHNDQVLSRVTPTPRTGDDITIV